MSRPKLVRWNDCELERLNPLLTRQMFSTANLTVARVVLQKGCIVPRHSHENEQISYIESGALKFLLDEGEPIVVRGGEFLLIPPHMPHAAEALEETVDVDIFYPPRQDWISKSDAYLRGHKTK